MKTYSIKKSISPRARAEINRIIETHEKYNRCFFFHPSTTAGGRRFNERKFKENNPQVGFESKEGFIEVCMHYEESCKNVYYKLHITLNGVKKNILFLKKLLFKVSA